MSAWDTSTGDPLDLSRLGAFAFRYEACDIPAGMTVGEFRAARSGPRRPSRRTAILRRLPARGRQRSVR